jgi:hypothetical protein
MAVKAVGRGKPGSKQVGSAAKPVRTKKPIKATKNATEAAPTLDPRLEALAKLFVRDRRVSLGKLFSSTGLKVDGRIFAMVVRGKLVVKLPKARVDELVAKKAGEYFDPGHGRPMKEWISMNAKKPDPLSLGREAFTFVSALK